MNIDDPNERNTVQAAAPPARQRLKPEVRMAQILDAALEAFSQAGYAATRMDDIAQRAGLSKGGLYAHFESKEAIFEALVQAVLRPVELPELPPDLVDGGARALAQWLVDQLHATVNRPEVLAMLRLMVAEGARVPELLARWDRQVMAPRMEMMARTLALLPTPPGVKPGVLSRAPWLMITPVVHALLIQAVFGEHHWLSREHIREVHVEMLVELLDPLSRLQSEA